MKISLKLFNQPLITAFMLSIFFFIFFSIHTLHRHNIYQSSAFDLGIYTQSIYLYANNLTPLNTIKHMLLLGDHFGLILVILSPIYKLFPSPVTLLIIQNVFVSLSLIPIYLISYRHFKTILLPIIISFIYLSSRAMTTAVFFDFHLATISVLPLSLILLFWQNNKWTAYFYVSIFSLLFKEDIPIFILGLGFYQLLTKQYKIAVTSIIISALGFYLIKFMLMPFFWPGSSTSYIDSSILPLAHPIDMASLLIIRPSIFIDQFYNSPIKVSTFQFLYQQFGFLPALDPLSWLTVIPYLLLRFSSTLTQLWALNFHHNANLLPFLAVSSILAIKRFHIPQTAALTILIIGYLFSGFNPINFFQSTYLTSTYTESQFSYIQKTTDLLPSNAAISAQSPLVPHLANRVKIYLYPEIYDADFIVLDSNLDSYPLTKPDLNLRISYLKSSPNWQIFTKNRSLIIFKKLPPRS